MNWFRSAVGCSAATVWLLAGCATGDADPATSTSLSSAAVERPGPAPTTSASASTSAAPTTSATLAPITAFDSSISPVSRERLGLSWREGCPVGAEDLRLVSLTHWNSFGVGQRGEIIVHADIAERTVEAFEELWDLGFVINKMETPERYIRESDIAADGSFIESHGIDLVNDTSAFMCRAMTNGRTFSEHSYGTAIDINPVQNPYIKGSSIIPTNGFADRDSSIPGTLIAGSPEVEAFTSRGFVWGGTWRTLRDYMHFSINGR